jgi:hypothetical protein
MMYNAEKYWVFGHCPLSIAGFQETGKHNVSETAYLSG